jgi:excisionase family DNA binding protein
VGDTGREGLPDGGLLSTAEFVAAVNLRRPKGTMPLTVRTCLRCIAAGEIERYRPGKRRWKIPEREVPRFVRDYRWRPS